MKKRLHLLITFILTLNFLSGQGQTSEFVNEFICDKDTLTIYEQFLHDDTLRVFRYQYYFDKQDELIVKYFYPIKFRQKNIVFRAWRRKLNELHFNYKSDCVIPKRTDALAQLETSIRNTKRHISSCKEIGKISISIDKKTYSSKKCTCGQAVYMSFRYKTRCQIEDNYHGDGGGIY